MTELKTITGNSKTHVFIISSNISTRKQLEEGLRHLGYETCSSSDGETALEMLKQRRIDVAIASSDLFGMNGIQLSRAITRIHPNVPVIIMSQQPESGQVAQALSSGAVDVVSESTNIEEMDSTIKRSIERKATPIKKIVTDRADTLFRTVRILTAAIDAKSHYAAHHSAHVTYLSLQIGKRLGLSPERMATLELAAQLHDIGKIGTPEAVLTKPDVLTDEEWVDVLKHPALGSAFLANIPELSEISAIVRHHHEHFDGTGYPDGLKGDAIPLFSRIIAVADAYDAITSERPYRKSKTHTEAIEEISKNAGKQFDGTMVQHLISALEENVDEKKAA